MVLQPHLPSAIGGHVVSLTMNAWGHTKAACTVVSKIVRFGRCHATVFVPVQLYERSKKEIANNFIPGAEDELKALIRVVGIECDLLPIDLSLITANFLDGYRTLLASQPIKVLPTNDVTHGAIAPPQLIIMDFFAYDALKGVKQETGDSIPVYALQSVSATALLFLWGPEYIGGGGDFSVKLDAITETDEKEIMAEADKIYRRVNGELLRIPGLPPMYDHEFSPQKPILDLPIAFINSRAHKFFVECDGAVMNSTSVFEGPAIDAIEEWFGERPVICPAPFDYPVVPKQKDEEPALEEVKAFLDAALEKHGSHSVVYMSFGTVWWVSEPEKVWAVLDIMIENDIPFLYSIASPFANMPGEVATRIEQSGLGLASKWLPQSFILNHEACGWFITHCGHNSVMETITAGVPMICWPIEADQPCNAAIVSSVHEIGYELFSSRSWHGLKPIHRLGSKSPSGTVDALRDEFKSMLESARGEDGKKRRENVRRLREQIAKEWEGDGDEEGMGKAWMQVKRIVDVLQA